MKNPVSVVSQDLTQFGFTATFDFLLKKIVFDISDLTVFTNAATDVNSIVFNVKDPNGYSYPQATQNLNTLVPVEISLGNLFNFGPYTIEAILTDGEGKQNVIRIDKNICAPEKWDGKSVPGKYDVDVDCRIPRVKITEKTVCPYMGKEPIAVQKDGKLFYPDNVLNELSFTSSPFTIGENSGLYTGLYRVKATTKNTYDLGDNIFVLIPFVTRQEFSVTCESNLNSILCCVSDLYQTYKNNRSNTAGSAAKVKLESVSTDLLVILLKDQTGKDSSVEVNRIKTILNCDCGCDNVSYIEPQLLSGGNGGNINIQGAGGTVVVPDISGDTTTYLVRSKEPSMIKADPDDLSFSISTSKTQTTAVFSIEFDYLELSTKVLNTIASDDDLKTLLNQIVNATTNVLISNLNGRCVINLTTALYTLSESAGPLKIVKNIVIGNLTYIAPSGLASNNAAGLKTWLDSLASGTFSVALNSQGNQVTISSNNSNSLSTMTFETSGVQVTKQFAKNSGSLTDILQAMIDYICDLHAGQVDLENTINLSTLVNGNVVNTEYAAGSSLQLYLQALGTALTYYANNPLAGQPGDDGDDGISVQVFVQPNAPVGTSENPLRNGDIWIVQ